ncbi:MAG: hypothetical protein ACTSR0_04050 [Candidatus Asgardarchaeia archaeon]
MSDFSEGLVVGLIVGVLVGIPIGWFLAQLFREESIVFDRDELGRIIGIHSVRR